MCYMAVRMVLVKQYVCSCSCPLTGDLTSSACVCGCVVDGVSATGCNMGIYVLLQATRAKTTHNVVYLRPYYKFH